MIEATESREFPLPGLPRPVPDQDSEPFWRGLAEGELRAPYCAHCARFHFPALPACPYCGRSPLDWRRLESQPTVYSWIVVHRAPHPDIPVPYTVVLGQFAEGVRIPGNLADDPGSENGTPPRAGDPLAVSVAERDGVHVVVYRRV